MNSHDICTLDSNTFSVFAIFIPTPLFCFGSTFCFFLSILLSFHTNISPVNKKVRKLISLVYQFLINCFLKFFSFFNKQNVVEESFENLSFHCNQGFLKKEKGFSMKARNIKPRNGITVKRLKVKSYFYICLMCNRVLYN